MSKFSEMFVYLRKSHHLSQQELADKLGLSRSIIGMYETGKRYPQFETLEAIADFFNVNMDTLTGHELPFTGTDPLRDIASRYDSSAPLTEKEISQAKRELIAAVDGLTDEQCEHLKALIDMVKR